MTALTAVPLLYLALAGPAAAGRPAPPDTALAAAGNAFGFALLQTLVASDPAGNVFVSPVGVGLALHMAMGGAAGETRARMAEALCVPDIPPERINSGTRALLDALVSTDSLAQLAVTSSLWHRREVALAPEFVAVCREFYRARAGPLDFTSPAAVDTVNAWVSRSTSGSIPAVVDQIGDDAILLVLNAICFRGRWADGFDTAFTVEQPFSAGDDTVPVEMMSRAGEFSYCERPGEFQTVALPFAGDRFRLYVFLPADTGGLAGLVASLHEQAWAGWLRSFAPRPGEVRLPRLALEYENSLAAPLAALGMDRAFQPGSADFSLMTGGAEGLSLSEVLHKAVIELDEQGASAAVFTESDGRRPFRFVCDRPFLCAVVDNPTGTIILIGAVREP
ncbi:hypothetical protein FJY71_00030 [candidate division WOR-3 bacterium]|nr:hypothetical protein [candidate division WOR-3 bacterium]